jgi:two-component system sensor histidine kinase/response regulator
MRLVPRLALAVVIPLVTCGLQWAFWDVLSPYVWLLFFPAVFFSAALTGLQGGITATVVSMILIWYVFLPPRFMFAVDKPHSLVPVIVFVGTSICFSLFSEHLRRLNRSLAAREGDARLRKVLDGAADAVFIADPGGRVIYANQQASALLGYEVAELLQLGNRDLMPAAEIARVATERQALRERGQVRAEIRLRRKDGSEVPVEVNATILPDGNVFGSCRDISEIIKARRALQQSERLFHAAFEAGLDAVTISRLGDGSYIEVSQAFHDVLGYTRDEVIGRTSADLDIWADAADRRRLIEALQREGKCPNQEFRFRKKSGALMWGLMSATVMELDGVACILAVTRDITDVRQAQDELERHRSQLEQLVQERTAELQDANGKLLDTQFAMDAVGIAIHWVDGDSGRFLYVNKIAAEALGYTVAEMLGRSVWDIDPNVDRARFARLIARLRREQLLQFESTNRCKDGRIIPVEVIIHYQGGKTAAQERCIAFLTDISRRKETERALVHAKEAAEAANIAKSAFLANMSHEIRTPLHVIIGLGHLLRREVDDPVQMERLGQLCASSDHLLAVVNDVLELSKIDAQRLTLDQRDFKLTAVVDKVVRMIEGRVQEKGLTLSTDLAPQLRDVALNGDALRLAQVLINLCDNAVKFTDLGAVRFSIKRLQENADAVTLRFAVEDTGIGIAPAQQAKVFQPFVQVDSSPTRERGGTGLGLAISQRIVALMGGTIQVESCLGAGSTFSFELTLPRAGAVLPTAAEAPAVSTETDFYGRRILFAEDHPLSQEILLEMLENLGCVVDVASDGVEAVASAQQRDYDLILMDVQMPIMDGFAATRAVRALPRHRATPIIALTANAFGEDRQRCLDAGMNGHIGKPVTPSSLAAALAQWLPNAAVTVAAAAAPSCENALSRALARIPGLVVGRAWRSSPQQLANYCVQLDRFIAMHSPDMARLRRHLDAGELEAAGGVAHSLQGIAGMLGARRIASLASEIVQGLRTNADKSIISFVVSACEAEFVSLAEATRALPTPAAESGTSG